MVMLTTAQIEEKLVDHLGVWSKVQHVGQHDVVVYVTFDNVAAVNEWCLSNIPFVWEVVGLDDEELPSDVQ